jgi:hypothetical protein
MQSFGPTTGNVDDSAGVNGGAVDQRHTPRYRLYGIVHDLRHLAMLHHDVYPGFTVFFEIALLGKGTQAMVQRIETNSGFFMSDVLVFLYYEDTVSKHLPRHGKRSLADRVG